MFGLCDVTKLMLAHLVAFKVGLRWQTSGGEEESSALQFSRVPREHLRAVTVCLRALYILVPPVFSQAGRTNFCGFRFNVYLSSEPGMKPMNSTDSVGWPSMLVWYVIIAAAQSL